MLRNKEIEAVFDKAEMNNEWNVNFLQNRLLGMKYIYSGKFSIGQSTCDTPFFDVVGIRSVIGILKYCAWDEF